MSLFWIFSGHDVKPHPVKAGPSSTSQCLPGLGPNTRCYSGCFWAGTAMPSQTNKHLYIVVIYFIDYICYYILQYIYLGSENRQPCGMKATEIDQSSERGKGKGLMLGSPVLSLGLILLCTSLCNLCHLK